MSSRAVRAFVCTMLALVIQPWLVSQPAAASSGWQPLAPGGSCAPAPSFRLGDAAAPFGFSSVVADFNTDGQPDVAVADHVARSRDQYAYRLQFSVSGQTGRPVSQVTFESTYEALGLRVADVDRDDDLDVIVDEPLSGETVAVWLNDGSGHFTQGNVRDLSFAIGATALLLPGDSSVLLDLAELPVRPLTDAAVRTSGFRPFASQRFRLFAAQLTRSALRSADTNPRAPPASRA